MRNLNYFALMSAALLTGAVAFTSCSSDDEVAGDGGTGATGEVVKTQFAISVPCAGNTRLAEEIVQGNTPVQFRGMTNIRLVPFEATGSPLSIAPTTRSSLEPIALPSIATSGLQVNGNYKVYNDVDIPVGVNYFLFYGEASEATAGSKTNGSIIPSYEVGGWPLGKTLGEIQFDLEDIIGTGSVTTSRDALCAILNGINNVEVGGTKWSAVASGDMKNYYDSFKSLKAGSANSIMAALQDLYNSMKSDKVSEDGNTGMKDAIATEIEKSFDANETNGVYTLTWKTAVAEAVKKFPANLGLPDGSQQLTFTDGTGFSYANPSTDVTNGNILQQTEYANYVYPASLFYTVATDIKTADNAMTNGNGVYNGTITDWSSVLSQTGWNTDAAVDAETRSIALVNPIQYAVASLNLFVRFADDYIYDNGDEWPNTTTPVGQIAVPVPADGFELTGILVGGQKPVGFDFHTKESVADDAAWTIYDASTDDAKVKKASGFGVNPTAYTLALETKGVTAGAAEPEKIRFALEMINNSGAAFVGKDGIVPAGGKFYLVGELVSETTSDGALKVFEQDHKTIANVTIKSLKSAYNCIPDLRAPKLELGLSVDLEWQEGLVSNVTIE